MQRALLIAAIAVVALSLACVVLFVWWRRPQIVESNHITTPLRVLTLVRLEPSESAESARLVDQVIGEWEVTASYINGGSVFVPNPERAHVYLFYKGLTPPSSEEPFGRQEWTIDGSQSPALADVRVIYDSTSSPAAARPGLVSIDGDRMEHCRAFGDETPRPATFEDRLAPGYAAMSFRRLK